MSIVRATRAIRSAVSTTPTRNLAIMPTVKKASDTSTTDFPALSHVGLTSTAADLARQLTDFYSNPGKYATYLFYLITSLQWIDPPVARGVPNRTGDLQKCCFRQGKRRRCRKLGAKLLTLDACKNLDAFIELFRGIIAEIVSIVFKALATILQIETSQSNPKTHSSLIKIVANLIVFYPCPQTAPSNWTKK